jgi:hypothetical protein
LKIKGKAARVGYDFIDHRQPTVFQVHVPDAIPTPKNFSLLLI